MRYLSVIGRVAAAATVVSVAFLSTPPPVAAECSFIPPMPKVSLAIGTARELFVGEVVANGTWNGGPTPYIFTVRIDEALRGPAKVGDIREFRYALPNWPWTNFAGGGPYPSCAYLGGRLGEHVILALGARVSGRWQTEAGVTWYQPPTTINTIGITEGSSREQYGSNGRQLFSLERLRELAGVSPPPTDTAAGRVTSPPAGPEPAVWLIGLAGLVGGLVVSRRTAHQR